MVFVYREACRLLLIAVSAAVAGLCASAASADGCWSRKADFPFTAAREPLSVSTATVGYVGNTFYSRAFYRYNPSSDVWRSLANIPGNFAFQAPAFAWQGKPHAVVGTQLYRFEPATNGWSLLGRTPTPDMRAGFALVSGAQAYLGGGFYNRAAFWRYNLISGQWIRLGNLPDDLGDCIDCSGFTLSGKLYVTGTNTAFWRYDPATGTWAQRASVASTYGRAFKIGTTGYVLNTRGTIYAYNPTANTWRMVTTQPGVPVCSPAVLTLGDQAYIAFGALFTNNTCTLDPSNVVWQWTPSQTCAR